MTVSGGDKQPRWRSEFYVDDNGHRPTESWMDKLPDVKFAALDAAITYVLEVDGIDLARTSWLKSLGDGLYEFRVRHTAEQIKRMYAIAGEADSGLPAKILLRLFVHFHGAKVILLVSGYDKGIHNSTRWQQREIVQAKKFLAEWQRRNT